MGGSAHLSFTMGALMGLGGAYAFVSAYPIPVSSPGAALETASTARRALQALRTWTDSQARAILYAGKGSKASLIAGGSIGALFVGRYEFGCAPRARKRARPSRLPLVYLYRASCAICRVRMLLQCCK